FLSAGERPFDTITLTVSADVARHVRLWFEHGEITDAVPRNRRFCHILSLSSSFFASGPVGIAIGRSMREVNIKTIREHL
ncbi:hypothetical protein, partial [Komagataeibacter xylinus]